MRFEATCPCGSSVGVDFAPHALNTRETERQVERNEAHKLIDQWRAAHRPCLKRLGETPAAAAPDFDVDAHDDDVEDTLLDRLQRDGLLKDGMSAPDVRAVLDA